MLKFRKLRCSFCRRDEDAVAKLVAGPRVYICDQCVTVASRMMDDSSTEKQVELTLWRRVSDLVGRLFHGSKAVNVSG